METEQHHVAWADRIGFNKQWARDIEICSDTFGTTKYPTMVRRFKTNITNIKGGPALKDTINTFIDNQKQTREHIIQEWVKNNPQLSQVAEEADAKHDDITIFLAEQLYEFIIQLLEDNNFGFYESNVAEDEME